ncbi:hypothetical protein [Govanella unica]|uniref:Uncharacterized protein n=1 Tax=Govanella unica TaxID=2975056 RepID=A0A9X3TZ57_9PROT|nr:hypothetical protein [Govania unica]MDA5194382.1 hypothetical protein [Govania unica]
MLREVEIMGQFAKPEGAKFEATLYNREVQAYLKSGKKHPRFYAGWAYQNIITVIARSIEEARKRIRTDYPETEGFVLMAIEPYHQHGWRSFN